VILRASITVVALAALLVAPRAQAADPPSDDGHPLTLDQALESALAKNQSLVIEREVLASAGFALSGARGARGAYDPRLEIEASGRRVVLGAENYDQDSSRASGTRSSSWQDQCRSQCRGHSCSRSSA
jgi:hypothetical protein